MIFTDGESNCSPNWGDRLAAAGKRICVVYLAEREKEASSPLDDFAADRAVLRIPS